MRSPYSYRIVFSFVCALLIGSWSETAQAVSFASGDGTGCTGGDFSECVSVNTKTTYQPGWSQPEPGTTGSNTPLNVVVLNGSGSSTTYLTEHPAWYHPTDANGIITGIQSLNSFIGETAHWVSYTTSGVRNDGAIHPFLPAVPNYCGTSPGGGGGGNLNPTGNPPCTPGFYDERNNQARSVEPYPPGDTGRQIGNQTAKFTERVTLGAGSWDMELYAWTDDTLALEVLGPDNNLIAMNPSNPFPAHTNTSIACADQTNPVACVPSAGGKFTASGLGGGTYTFNFYSFQVGSDVFGSLWGGVFTQGEDLFPGNVGEVPEPASVVLMASGLVGLGLFRRWYKES